MTTRVLIGRRLRNREDIAFGERPRYITDRECDHTSEAPKDAYLWKSSRTAWRAWRNHCGDCWQVVKVYRKVSDELPKMFEAYPLGCKRFGAEWLRRWEGIGRLLQKPAVLEIKLGEKLPYVREWYPRTLGIELVEAIAKQDLPRMKQYHRRVALLDGTVVREWGPK